MIPFVVKDFSLEVARDPTRRNYARTDPATVTVAIGAGVANVSALFTDAGSKVYKETFPLADLYVANGGDPLRVRLVHSRQQLKLTRTSEADFISAHWDGPSMYFRSPAGRTDDLADTLQVQASKELASDLSDLDSRLHQDFIKYLAVRAAAELGRVQQQQQPAK